MKLAAIHASKVSALVEIFDLIPQGKIFLPDLINVLVTRCDFKKFPADAKAYSDPAGMIFEFGKWDGQPINKLTVFRDGILLETSSSTEDTDATLRAMLLWAKESIGIHFEEGMIKRKLFVSQVVVYFDVELDMLHPILKEIGKVVSESANRQFNQPLAFRTSTVTLSPNTLTSKFYPTVFSIERRLDVPDIENKYFCTAPLPTVEHLKLLEKFENSLKR